MNKATKQLNRFDSVAFSLLAGVMALILCYLTLACMWTTSVLDSYQSVTRVRDSLWLSLLLPAAGILLCRAALLGEQRAPLRLLTGLALGLVFMLGCTWVLIARVPPQSDAYTLYYHAKQLVEDDCSFLQNNPYLQINAHQVGFILFSALLQRVFGVGSYLPQGILNAAFLTAGYAALLDILWQSLHSRRVQLVALVMIVMCLPPVLYCTFLYGNLPGLCLSLWALALVVRWIRGARWPWLILACGLMAAAVVLKPNYLIFALALAAITALYALSARRLGALALAACLLIGSAALPKGTQWMLEKHAGTSLGPGAPMLLWMAMGLQDGPQSAGWYNGYAYTIPVKYEMDFEALKKKILFDIQERLTYFIAHPAEAHSFFRTKMLSQWAETTYESLYINRKMHSNRNPSLKLCEEILNGRTSKVLSAWMEGFAIMLYAGVVLGLVRILRALRHGGVSWQTAIGLAVLLTAVFGGGLYHMLFEAASQYIMVYIPMLIPFAAIGWSIRLPARRSSTQAPSPSDR